ncbi:MAG: penicillin-binding transpeptidase domain-containing protein [Patescibacteria group bacterium]
MNTTQSWLSWFLRGVLILGFLILSSRLIELQVIKGSYYRSLSEENRIKRIPIVAPRGRIFARGGEILEGKNFAHITGFVGEANKDEVFKIDPGCIEKGPVRLGEMTGRGGLNEKYNCILRGIDGEELVEVDTSGKTIRTLGEKKATPGSDLHTTIDFGLQNKVAESMEGKIGAVIASDLKGEILALYSYPSFDPLRIESYLNDQTLPFFNRAIGGAYHPGSVFKPVVAIAALSDGQIDKDFTYNDTGQIKIDTLYGDFSYSNWYFIQYGRSEGTINLVRALARSTDTFFYTVGEMIGPEKIAELAHKFMLDKKTGIDIPGEVAGLIPTPDWKEKVKKEKWFLGNTYHLSIGQGDVALTPLGVNVMTATIANGGKFCKPYINEKLKTKNEKCKESEIKKDNLDLVKEGMRQVCLPAQTGTTGGTGFTFFDYKESVFCKTGTAEVGTDDDTHAWFTLFNADLALTVLVEKGGEGSKVAGPIARSIMDYEYLRKNP